MGDLRHKLQALDSVWERRRRIADYLEEQEQERVDGDAYLGLFDRFREQREELAAPAPVCLYLHLPLCASKCLYCSCYSRRIASADDVGEHVDGLVAQLALVAPHLRGVPMACLSIGGGTPTLLTPAQIHLILGETFERFELGEGFHFSCEANPRGTTRAKLEALTAHGVHRVSFGVQSLTPAVLQSVGRGYQTAESVQRAVGLAHEAGVPAVNVDLIAGLPGETDESFAETIEALRAMGVDSIVVYRWLSEHTPLTRFGLGPDQEDRARGERHFELARRLLLGGEPPPEPTDLYAIGCLFSSGPEVINLYEELRQEHGASVVGLGFGARSALHATMTSRSAADSGAWHADLARGVHPAMSIHRVDPVDAAAAYVAANLNRGLLRGDAFEALFGRDLVEVFGAELDHAVGCGYLARDGDCWRKVRELDAEGERRASFTLDGVFATCASLDRTLERILREDDPRAGRTHGCDLPICLGAVQPLHLLRWCSLACVSCPWSSSFDGTKVSKQELLDQIDAIARAGLNRVAILGGEPTNDPRLPAVARRLRRVGVQQLTLWTNGRRFQYAPFVAAIHEAGITSVVVSLHGASSESHDAATRFAGSFDDTVGGIGALCASPIDDITARLVLGPETVSEAPEVMDRVWRLGVRDFVFDLVGGARLDAATVERLHQVESAHELNVSARCGCAPRAVGVDGPASRPLDPTGTPSANRTRTS